MVEAQIRLVVDPDAEVDEDEEDENKYFMDFKCAGGSPFTFADFYK